MNQSHFLLLLKVQSEYFVQFLISLSRLFRIPLKSSFFAIAIEWLQMNQKIVRFPLRQQCLPDEFHKKHFDSFSVCTDWNDSRGPRSIWFHFCHNVLMFNQINLISFRLPPSNICHLCDSGSFENWFYSMRISRCCLFDDRFFTFGLQYLHLTVFYLYANIENITATLFYIHIVYFQLAVSEADFCIEWFFLMFCVLFRRNKWSIRSNFTMHSFKLNFALVFLWICDFFYLRKLYFVSWPF